MMDEVHAMNELIIAGENWAASWKNVKKAKKSQLCEGVACSRMGRRVHLWNLILNQIKVNQIAKLGSEPS